eukprot:2089346-Alexandrium_andersonii.AAC.1
MAARCSAPTSRGCPGAGRARCRRPSVSNLSGGAPRAAEALGRGGVRSSAALGSPPRLPEPSR